MSTGPDSRGRWREHRARESSDADALAEVFNRFSLDSQRRHRRHRHAAPDKRRSAEDGGTSDSGAAAQDTTWPMSEPHNADAPVRETPAPQCSEDAEPATYIRPYAWTGGRTRSNHQLELETLVSTSELCQTFRLERLEHQSIADLCRHPRSVAEVGAILGVPLGVTRVLLGDMADLGLITVHRTITNNGGASHLILMERVLSGLRRL
jgi:hypothetical protein